MYQLLLKDGSKTGQYNPNSSPGKTAEKMAKQIYIDENMEGTQKFRFDFVKNRINSLGGDKRYSFEATVTPLPRTAANRITVGGKTIQKRYSITVKNLLRE